MQLLHGRKLEGSEVAVQAVDDGLGDAAEPGTRRVRWRNDDELWQVVVFSRTESVEEMGRRIEMRDFRSFETAVDRSESRGARFEAARRAELERERQHAPKALAGDVEEIP